MFARTERLLLRPGWAEDAHALHTAIAHEEVAMKLARLPWPYGLDDAKWWLGQSRNATDASFLIFARTEGAPKLIGGIGLHDQDGETEIGYWITPSEWGKGYVTEAGRAVVEIAQHTLRLERLVSGHFIDNPASGKVLKKLGFQQTGRVEQRHCLARQSNVPCVLYAQNFGDEAERGGDNDDSPTWRMCA